MKRIFALILFSFLFSTLAATSNAASEPISALCLKIQECRQAFIENDCDSFVKAKSSGDKKDSQDSNKNLISCQEDEVAKGTGDSFSKILSSCGEGVKDSALMTIHKIASLPDHVFDNFNENIAANKAAQAICQEKLGYNFDQAWKAKNSIGNDFDNGKKLRSFNECQGKESAKILNYHLPKIPNLTEIKQALLELDKARKCFKVEAQAKIVCPVAASLVAGGAAGFALKRGIMAASSRLASTGGKAEAYVEDIGKLAQLEKERLSYEHQKDLLDFSDSAKGKALAKKTGLNVDDMKMGMADSDLGKNHSVWVSKVLSKSEQSEELLNVLAGRSSSPAGIAMKEIMDEAGMGSKTILNPKLNNETLRETIKKSPILEGYMHEIPGMSNAIEALNAKRITVVEFKNRMKANLFHNGPHAGFWGDELGDIYVPGALNKAEKSRKEFFKNTVFDRGPNESGVYAPKYPGPISPEGVFHTVSDRISQGSRGGMLKIFSELGGEVLEKNPKILLGELKDMSGLPAGLKNLGEMMLGNPGKTQKQLVALNEHLLQMKQVQKLDTNQFRQFQKLLEDSQKRLDEQMKFINSSVIRTPNSGPIQQIEIKFKDANGNWQKKIITDQTPANEAQSWMNQMMLSEEKVNGDPMRELGLISKGLLATAGRTTVVAAATALSAPPLSCRGKISDVKGHAPNVNNPNLNSAGAH